MKWLPDGIDCDGATSAIVGVIWLYFNNIFSFSIPDMSEVGQNLSRPELNVTRK